MKSFFDSSQFQNSTTDGTTLFHSCHKCGLYKDCLSPDMQPCGNFRKGILNIGEAPGNTENERGKPWQGKVGKRLKRAYRQVGIDLFEDCLNINSVNCMPPGPRTPTSKEIGHCRGKVMSVIQQYQPKVIVLFGNAAIESLLGHRVKGKPGGITKWRGWTAPDRDLGAWVCPAHHPSFIERDDTEEKRTVWMQDLERAASMYREAFPRVYENLRAYVTLVDPDSEYFAQLMHAITGIEKPVAFDYEATGLKPHATGHEIVCASVCPDNANVYSFMLPTKRRKLELFKRFLRSSTPKIAANMDYEENWSWYCLDTKVQNWHFDTMQAAHILDNRPGITSVKFQGYVYYGVLGYDSAIEPYLKGKEEKNANSFNRIHEFIERHGQNELLYYCGIDSLLERWLAMDQIEQLLPF